MQHGVFSFTLLVGLVLMSCCLSSVNANPTIHDVDDVDNSDEENSLEFVFTVEHKSDDEDGDGGDDDEDGGEEDGDDDEDATDEEYDSEEYYDEYEQELTADMRETLSREPYRRNRKWKESGGWRTYPLFIIVLGGLRWDYLKQYNNLSAFAYLQKHGTTIPFVNSIFPTEDYPTWTSIATGRFAEDHSIVGDYMYDLKGQSIFNASDMSTTRHASWWKFTTPFWSTAATHGKKIAFYNWHDCQLPGAAIENTADCKPYTPIPGGTAPSRSKIARQFNEAFTKLYKNGYHVSVAYTDLLRRKSEKHGPKSPEMQEALKDLDDVLQAKLMDIRSKEERAGIKMNILVLSDYGTTDLSQTMDVYPEDYLDFIDIQYIIYSAGYATIIPFYGAHQNIIDDLQDMEGVDVYLTKRVQYPAIHGADLVPDELKYGKGAFAQDILIVAKPAFQIKFTDVESRSKIIRVHDLDDEDLKGGSGYNPVPESVDYPFIDKRTKITAELNQTIDDHNRYEKFKWDMRTQAFAMGPDFKRGYKMQNPVELVDFYQMICFLLQIPPEEHRGEWDRIAPMLTISSAPSVLSFTRITFSLFFIPIIVLLF